MRCTSDVIVLYNCTVIVLKDICMHGTLFVFALQVGCRGMSSADFQVAAAGLARLQRLSVGGGALSWHEDRRCAGAS